MLRIIKLTKVVCEAQSYGLLPQANIIVTFPTKCVLLSVECTEEHSGIGCPWGWYNLPWNSTKDIIYPPSIVLNQHENEWKTSSSNGGLLHHPLHSKWHVGKLYGGVLPQSFGMWYGGMVVMHPHLLMSHAPHMGMIKWILNYIHYLSLYISHVSIYKNALIYISTFIALRSTFYNLVWVRCVIPSILNLKLTHPPFKL